MVFITVFPISHLSLRQYSSTSTVDAPLVSGRSLIGMAISEKVESIRLSSLQSSGGK